jgi:hypothetical protein
MRGRRARVVNGAREAKWISRAKGRKGVKNSKGDEVIGRGDRRVSGIRGKTKFGGAKGGGDGRGGQEIWGKAAMGCF